MNSRPPARSRPATTPAQRAMSGSQHSAPIPVYTRSKHSRPRTVTASYTWASTNRTSVPARPARLRQRGGGEVQPGHAGAEAGQRDGVGADMALEVDAAQSADVTEQRQVEPHDLAEEGGVAGETLHRVVARGRVRPGP